MQSLRKSVISPYKKQVVCLPSNAVVGSVTSSSSCNTETQLLASPRNKGSSLKLKPSPSRQFAPKTWTSPRRRTPRKHAVAVAKTRMSTPLRKTKHFHVGDRKKTVATSKRTPNKSRSQTPRKSTKRTPAKGVLAVDNLILLIGDFAVSDILLNTKPIPYLFCD